MPFVLFILMLISVDVAAQTAVPFSSPRWKIKADSAVRETYLGRPALKLLKGTALLEDADFRNGIIEFDIALTRNRNFPSVEFRMQDDQNYEHYYLRPHQSGNPDAMQYTPVWNALAGWQLYYGPGFNNPMPLPFDRWLHVRLVVSGKQAEVFFDNDSMPVLYISRLKRDVITGMIRLSNPAPTPIWFSNLVYTRSDDVTIKSTPMPVAPLPAGTVTSWEVSSPFSENLVKDKAQLSASDTASLSWRRLNADELGITDLSRLSGVTDTVNTVFARMVINASEPGLKKLSFGFSDRARVYLNNRLLYAGDDGFMSRDYRFLGTIGYFDAVYLDLKPGRNELWIAVSETFGGWGIKARME